MTSFPKSRYSSGFVDFIYYILRRLYIKKDFFTWMARQVITSKHIKVKSVSRYVPVSSIIPSRSPSPSNANPISACDSRTFLLYLLHFQLFLDLADDLESHHLVRKIARLPRNLDLKDDRGK